MLVNRRGWSPFVDCRDCGRAWMCRSCDVSLTLHRDGDAQRLHLPPLRSRASRSPHACPDCGSTAVARHGAGTQRLEAELREALAPLPVFRLDTDAGRRKGGIAECCIASTRRLPASSWGPRWSPRGTTSPRSSWPSCRMPTRTCGSPTSARRSAPSRWSRSSPVAAVAGRRAGGCWCRRCARRPPACATPPRTMPPASSRRRWSAGGRCAIRRSRRLIRVLAAAPDQRSADAAAELLARRRRSLGDGLDVLGPAPLFRVKDLCRSTLVIKTGDAGGRGRGRGRGGAVGRRASARVRGVKLAVDVDPQ